MFDVWLSIKGLYDYDSHIFDEVSFPGDIAKDVIIRKIIFDNAELGLVYTDPKTLKEMLRVWSVINQRSWERIWTALNEPYNPIENYDRQESWTDTGSSTAGVMGYNATTFTDANKVDTGNTRIGRVHGNIGVTTSAQMITQECEMREAQIYAQIISDSFRGSFCIMVY